MSLNGENTVRTTFGCLIIWSYVDEVEASVPATATLANYQLSYQWAMSFFELP